MVFRNSLLIALALSLSLSLTSATPLAKAKGKREAPPIPPVWVLGSGLNTVLPAMDTAVLRVSEPSAYDLIHQGEKAIDDLYQRVDTRYSAEKFYEKVITPLEHSEPDWASYLREWETAVADLHSKRYLMLSEKQALYMMSTFQLADQWYEARNNEDQLSSQAQTQFAEIRELYEMWRSHSGTLNEDYYPTHQRDRKRGFRKMTQKLRDFMVKFGGAQVPMSYPQMSFYGPEMRSLAWKTFWRSKKCTVELPDSTPFLAPGGLTPFLAKAAQFEGFTFMPPKVDPGYYKLNLKGDGKTRNRLNLFLPSHRGQLTDAYLLFQLPRLSTNPLTNFMLFSNPTDYMKVPFLAKALANIPEFIAVGKTKGKPADPVEKLLLQIQAGTSVNAINFAQGFVPDAGEFLPINSMVVADLLARLLRENIQVTLIPISFVVGSDFLPDHDDKDHLSVDNKKLGLVIHRPILPEAVKALVEFENRQATEAAARQEKAPRYFEHFLASLWTSTIRQAEYTAHKEYGEYSLEDLLARAQDKFTFDYSQAKTFSVDYWNSLVH